MAGRDHWDIEKEGEGRFVRWDLRLIAIALVAIVLVGLVVWRIEGGPPGRRGGGSPNVMLNASARATPPHVEPGVGNTAATDAR